MTKAIIYHNPRCSKSRCSLEILKDKGVEIEEVHYLERTPSKATLKELCALMSVSPLKIIRTGETLFKELGLSKSDVKTDDEWLEILVTHPKLIERPIIKIGDKVVLGRPPENVLSILP
ncbi:MAG: arsenate reductase (glutaredoxin) [Thiomicrorhabdus sp.]|nr:arsenate reductase (glutaredoxin) [Thiomicrorhabdus sp.]